MVPQFIMAYGDLSALPRGYRFLGPLWPKLPKYAIILYFFAIKYAKSIDKCTIV